ncbi:MAG TPA: hypothetical protein VI895_10385 [Bdellovibrionota bacterium]|nr:hypothetical protein [Bdellovibrionota bacterium]
MNITKHRRSFYRVAVWAAALALFATVPLGGAAEKLIPKDALVLETAIPVRQFPDAKGKPLAKLQPCAEILILERTSGKKGSYVKVLFLSDDAQKVRRGWIRRDSPLYIFPEPRPAMPRADATPEVAFPWSEKSPQPGDPDFARVTKKSFLFECLKHPHPAKSAAILTQILDRYSNELAPEEVVLILPLLVNAREGDYARIRELLARFRDNPEVAKFLAANPMFGPVIEPEVKAAPVFTPPPTPTPELPPTSFMNIPYKILGIGLVGIAAGLTLIALVLRSRKKKTPPPPFDEPKLGDNDPTFTNPG